jgi:hypothetical protein
LTDISEESGQTDKRRGPRTMLADNLLVFRREQFVQVFEGLWGEIGWELQKSKREGDIMRALHPLDGIEFIRELASMFYRESTARASAAIVHKVRAELHEVQQTCGDADEARRRDSEALAHVDAILVHSPDNKRNIIRRAQKKYRKTASKSMQAWQTLSQRQKTLDARLKALEASFARQEVVRFCKSKRYELNPVNLANAVAGLPYMGWRQSMRRSIECRSMIADGLDYQIFKAIRFIAQNARKPSEKAFVGDFRETVPRLPSRHRAAREVLSKQWLFLERAVRRAFRSKPHPKALPFEIAKHYFREIRTKSDLDILIAHEAALRLPSQKK